MQTHTAAENKMDIIIIGLISIGVVYAWSFVKVHSTGIKNILHIDV